MRREGRQRGWVVCFLGMKARHAVYDGAAAANGGLVRAPRKPTNHSKPSAATAYENHYRAKAEKGRYKFKHDETKTYRREARDLLDGDDDDNGADYE
ncbi:unnamed protein product [Urochloa decumbens]|uniref:Uncharacterized protein n=1 Tax=Urochloa decumbens TaxID=240449 RepID=A0ABC8Z2Y6_9POAL